VFSNFDEKSILSLNSEPGGGSHLLDPLIIDPPLIELHNNKIYFEKNFFIKLYLLYTGGIIQ